MIPLFSLIYSIAVSISAAAALIPPIDILSPTTIATNNVSTNPNLTLPDVQCSPLYGRRLDYQDCRDAYNYIPRFDGRVARFAQRHTGVGLDIALPQRVVGSMCAFLLFFFKNLAIYDLNIDIDIDIDNIYR